MLLKFGRILQRKDKEMNQRFLDLIEFQDDVDQILGRVETLLENIVDAWNGLAEIAWYHSKSRKIESVFIALAKDASKINYNKTTVPDFLDTFDGLRDTLREVEEILIQGGN